MTSAPDENKKKLTNHVPFKTMTIVLTLPAIHRNDEAPDENDKRNMQIGFDGLEKSETSKPCSFFFKNT